MNEIIIRSLEDLAQLSEELLPKVREHKKIAFYGEIGAGKTTFIKLLCDLLGVKEQTSSPSFSIINQYLSTDEQTIYHIDLYRMNTEEEVLDLGVLDILDSDSYCFIEWPEIIEAYIPNDFMRIKVEHDWEGERKFLIFFKK